VFLASNTSTVPDVTVTPPSGVAPTSIQSIQLMYQPDPVGPVSSSAGGASDPGPLQYMPPPFSAPERLVPSNPSAVTAQPYAATLTYSNFTSNGAAAVASGWYDVWAEVTTTDGACPSTAPCKSNTVRVVVDDDNSKDAAGTYLGLLDPTPFVSGPLSLTAACEGNARAVADRVLCAEQGSPASNPASMTFWISRQDSSGADVNWTPVATANATDGVTPIFDSFGLQEFNVPNDLDTSTEANGTYDLTVTATDAPPNDGNTYMAAPDTFKIDNTPPTVTFNSNSPQSGAAITGTVTLSANAAVSQTNNSLGVSPFSLGVRVKSVTFQYAVHGTSAWKDIGGSTSGPPYERTFQTQSLPNDHYDLRAIATDTAGNSETVVVSDVTITNPPTNLASAVNLRISTMTAPASNVSLLGEVTGGPDQGVWAVGTTTAPPPTVGGVPLHYPYPVQPGTEQPVVLHHTDGAGWQITGALDNADGSSFSDKSTVTGEVTASGEGWIVVTDGKTAAVFFRPRGGSFTFDSADTDALTRPAAPLTPLLVGSGFNPREPPTVELGRTSAGQVGMLVSPPAQSATAAAAEYGVLSPNCTPGQTQTACWQINSLPSQSGGNSSSAASSANCPPPTGNSPSVSSGDALQAFSFSPTGTVTGWGEFAAGDSKPLLLSPLGSNGCWGPFVNTGLDPLDLNSDFGSGFSVRPTGVVAASDGVWIEAGLDGPGVSANPGASNFANVVALYDPSTGKVQGSWCTKPVLTVESVACDGPIDANHPATLPDSVVGSPSGPVALGLANGFIDAYSAGNWSQVAAPGFTGGPGKALFSDTTDGWLAGANAVGEVSDQVTPPALAEWPEANQSTLTSVALPPAGAGIGTSGALAVGLDGAALHYDSTNGWLVDAVPPQAQGRNLLSVAYDGPSRAVAVGDFGTILDWNGTGWSADPQSTSLTENQLNAVSFGSDGQGWAVGNSGTILHFDGTAWSDEQIDAADSGENVTSVAVAGRDVFAIAGGNLLERKPGGGWQQVADCAAGSVTPSCLPPGVQGSLTLVSGLRDGGAAVAGESIVLVRQDASSPFDQTPQPIQGTVVALSAFRDPGVVQAFVSVAPSVQSASGVTSPTGNPAFAAGDGELLRETATGWQDVSQSQNPASAQAGRGQEGPEPDPVLAVAAAPDGSAAWAVGGFAGTQTAAGLGSSQPLNVRPAAWQTSSIWRYDTSGPAQPPTLSQAQVSLPAQPDTVSFAFFSDTECNLECAAVSDPQPMINLGAANAEIAQYAAQPGGPSLAVLGGNAVGPSDATAYSLGSAATADFANLGQYLSPLGGVPLYAAFGQLDQVPSETTDPALSWGQAFQGDPAPFGGGPVPSGITQASPPGGLDAGVHHYYDYDVNGPDGGTLRVIVLDNSAGSLDASAPGQSSWLSTELSAAEHAGIPVVVVCSEPLDSGLPASQPPSVLQQPANDADAVATELANAGVLAVFTSSPTQRDTTHMIPFQQPGSPPSAQPQIPEYEGGAVGYQQEQNHGVLWYLVSVDTATGKVTVQGIPVVQSLALEPLTGLTAPRSSTLQFQAVGRRPSGSLLPGDDPEGIANYVGIPSTSCAASGGGGCVQPSYKFTSSNPLVGNFVQASGQGSRQPALVGGKTVASSTSGLFCAFNPGTTKVSVTSGLLTSSLTVTVKPGGIGQPCGTVPDAAAANHVRIPGKTSVSSAAARGGNPSGAAPPPAAANPAAKSPSINAKIPTPAPKPAAPAPKPAPTPAPKPAPTPAPKPAAPAPKPAPTPAPVPAPVKKAAPPPAPKPGPVPASKPPPAPAPRPPAPAPAATSPPFISQSNPALSLPPPAIFPPIPLPVTTVPPGGATVPGQATARREERARKHARQSAYVTRPAGASAEEWFYPTVGVMTVFALWLISNGIRVGPKRRLALAEDRVTTDPRRRRPMR